MILGDMIWKRATYFTVGFHHSSHLWVFALYILRLSHLVNTHSGSLCLQGGYFFYCQVIFLFLPLEIFSTLESTLVDWCSHICFLWINVCMVLAFNLSKLLNLKWVSVGSCFSIIQSVNLCLLIGTFRPLHFR